MAKKKAAKKVPKRKAAKKKGAKARSLSPKQARFVEEYLIDCNATQAAMRAEYSKRTAKSQGARLLTNVDIAAAIAKAQAERSQRVEITADAVLEELALLGFSNMLDYISVQEDGSAYVDLSMVDRDQAAAIGEFVVETYYEPGLGEDDAREVKKTKLKLSDKRSSLELIGKHLGIWHTKAPGTKENPLTVQDARPQYDLSKLTRSETKTLRTLLKKATLEDEPSGD